MQWDLEAQRLDQVSGLGVNLQLAVGVRQVQGRDLWDVLVLSLTLLLLQLERDTTDWALLDSLHQVGGVTGDLVSESLGLDLGDLRGQSLVGLEVQSQLWVESLDQNLRGSLDSLSSNTTLVKLVFVGAYKVIISKYERKHACNSLVPMRLAGSVSAALLIKNRKGSSSTNLGKMPSSSLHGSTPSISIPINRTKAINLTNISD